MAENKGKLFCEACGFDFKSLYGERGHAFIEAHHTKPVSELRENEKTNISDIKMLCSNCHRIIHKSPMLSVNELRVLIEKNKK